MSGKFSPPDEIPTGLQKLVEECCNSTLTEDASRQLNERLSGDCPAQSFYLAYLGIHAYLIQEFGPVEFGPISPAASVGEVAELVEDGPAAEGPLAAITASEEDQIVEWARAKRATASRDDRSADAPSFRSSAFATLTQLTLLVLALAGIVGVTLWVTHREDLPQPLVAPEGPSLARVVKATDCTWAEGAVVADGDELDPGCVLELVEGVAEIAYGSGVLVSIVGPTRLEFTSDEAGTLYRGQLSATVPKQAAGFVVRTPAIDVVDRGTQFGVRVDETGRTEVHVFQGEVETQVRGDGKAPEIRRRLATAQAARFNIRGRLVDWMEPDYRGFAGVERYAPGVVGTSRDVRWLPQAPPSLEEDAFESDSSVFLLLERRGVALQCGAKITALRGSGTHCGSHCGKSATLPPGTRVDSYLLHFDPSTLPQSRIGGVHFERPILGIIARGDQLQATDEILGVAGTRYESGNPQHRGLDEAENLPPDGPDVVNYLRSTDRLTIRFGVQAGTLDEVRILVASEEQRP